MKHALKSVRALAATLITFGALAGGANAAVIFSFQEVAGNVVMTSSGSIDTSGLVSTGVNGWAGVGIEENGVADIMGGTSVGDVNISFTFNQGTDLSAWQSANPWDASFFGFVLVTGSKPFTTFTRVDDIIVPGLGVRSSDLSGTIWSTDQTWTANGETLASIGLNEGIYTITDSVSGESITYQIGLIPEPSSALLFGIASLGFAASRRRNHQVEQAAS